MGEARLDCIYYRGGSGNKYCKVQRLCQGLANLDFYHSMVTPYPNFRGLHSCPLAKSFLIQVPRMKICIPFIVEQRSIRTQHLGPVQTRLRGRRVKI